MPIAYFDPLGRAWDRMRSLLFAPFQLRTWLVVGFTAWLAGLFDNDGSASSAWSSDDGTASEWGKETIGLFEAVGIGLLLVLALVALLALVLLLLWVSSRGKFVFLDNVVRSEAAVVDPWKRYAARGDSLFVWRFLFGIVVLLLLGLLILPVILMTGIAHGAGWETLSALPIVLYVVAVFVVVVIPAAYTSLFLDSFVVPIMYQSDVSATQAWGRFLPLLRENLLHFVLYGIVMLVLNVAVVAVVIGIGLFTCCVGFVLLALPYVGTVLTLPAWVTLRAFSLEYLGQFGPDYRLLPEPPAGPGPVGPPPPPQPPRQTT